MPKNKKRKNAIASYREDDVNEAVQMVLNGTHSIRQAAILKGLARNTLHRYVTKVKKTLDIPDIKGRASCASRKIFTEDEEKALHDYLVVCFQMNYGLTKKNARMLAYEMAVKNEKMIPDNWMVDNMAGPDWLIGFMKRHPSLSVILTESSSVPRVTAFSRQSVQMFFTKLKEVYKKYPSFEDGNRVYNFSETSTTTAFKSKKALSTSPEKGTIVTTCFIINALGHALPPVMIFPRPHFKANMISDAPTETLGLATPTGRMTAKLFLGGLHHFIRHTKASKKNPALLVLDNHESHLSLPAIDLATANGIVMITVHPHCSYKLQPLNVSVFGPFKAFYASALDARILKKPATPISIYDIAALVSVAYEQAMTPVNITAGFKQTGIFPFDENIFTENDFAPSFVNDRLLLDSEPTMLQTKNPDVMPV